MGSSPLPPPSTNYKLPLRPGTLIFDAVDVLRSNPHRLLTPKQVQTILPEPWKRNSISGALINAMRMGGPVHRPNHGVFQYVPERDSADWGLGQTGDLTVPEQKVQQKVQPEQKDEREPEAPALDALDALLTDDRPVVLRYVIREMANGRTLEESEDGTMGVFIPLAGGK